MLYLAGYTLGVTSTRDGEFLCGEHGTITIEDSQRYDASKKQWIEIPFTFSSDRADANGSGYITLMDATYLQRWPANLPSNDKIGKML